MLPSRLLTEAAALFKHKFPPLPCGQSVPLDARHKLEEHQIIVIGMRSERFTLGSDGATLSAPATLVEPTGAETQITFEFAGGTAMADLDGGTDVQSGQMLTVAIYPATVHVFDKRSSRRI